MHDITRRDWTIGDDPRLHPLWLEQCKLELEMVQTGAEHFRDMVQNARDPGLKKDKGGKFPPEMTRILVYRRIMVKMVEAMGAAMKVWFFEYSKGKRGGQPIAYHRLNGMDPNVVALITCRTIMDKACNQTMNLYEVARSIGLQCEQETRRHWASCSNTQSTRS